MEGGKKSGSSITSDLFGSKSSSDAASSSEILESILLPPAKVNERKFIPSSVPEKKSDSVNQSWISKNNVSDNKSVRGEGHCRMFDSKDLGIYCTEEKQPFHYSSSIYYGGQDVYSRPQSAQDTVFTTFNKDGEEDDSGGASRGNWWQGSLYY